MEARRGEGGGDPWCADYGDDDDAAVAAAGAFKSVSEYVSDLGFQVQVRTRFDFAAGELRWDG